MGRRPSNAPGYAELKDDLVRLYGETCSMKACSRELGISVPTVRDWLKRAGVEVLTAAEARKRRTEKGLSNGGGKRVEIDPEKLRAMLYDQGMGYQEVADELGLHLETVRERIAEYGLKRTQEQIAEVRKSTNRARYGGDSPFADPSIAAAREATNMERYGTANPFAAEEVKERIRQSNLERYGVDNPGKSSEVAERRKLTNLERYGVEYAVAAPEVRARIRATAMKRHGVPARFLAADVLEANVKKYGHPNPRGGNIPAESQRILASRNSLAEFIGSSGVKTVKGLAELLTCSYTTAELRLKKYGLWDNLDHFTSRPEEELSDLVRSWGFDVVKDRKVLGGRREIDVYVPERKFGIEFNGWYWHSEKFKERGYHREKTLAAEAAGVELYHVFEWEWADPARRARVVEQLRHRLVPAERRVMARKCVVREVSAEMKRDFLRANHVQGNDRAPVRLGLFEGDELVALMTFTRPRFSRKYEWEMSRFCSLAGVSVPGGASKLFTAFVRGWSPSSVVSYADLAKTTGAVYPRLGFRLSHVSDPNYVWTDGEQVLTRYQTQMKGERQVMSERGFVRVFDCGNRVFVWEP